MKNFYILFLLASLGLFVFNPKGAKAQTVEILAGNTLNGAIEGTILGGAAMGLNNSTDFAYLRVGLGAGTLYGIGMGAYDLTHGNGSKILVSGFFNDGNNSSIIVLLDTFYGAAAGAIVATSVMLVANRPLLEGLQYGSSVGAWVGFGFGIFDTFVLASRTPGGIATSRSVSNSASGLLAVNFDNGSSLGFMNPTLIQTKDAGLETTVSPAMELMTFKINF